MCLPILIMLLVEKTRLSYKLIKIALVSAPLVLSFTDGEKAVIITDIVIAILSVAIVVYAIASTRKNQEDDDCDERSEENIISLICVLIFVPLLSFVSGINCVGRYTYLESWFPFRNGVLIISVVLGIALVVSMLKISAIKNKFWGSVGCFLLGTGLSIAILAVALGNLNYALDQTIPEIVTVTIEDKDIDRNRKRSDDYEFIFTVEKEKHSVKVPHKVYYDYEIGDTFEIKIYQGAFDYPFIMADMWE